MEYIYRTWIYWIIVRVELSAWSWGKLFTVLYIQASHHHWGKLFTVLYIQASLTIGELYCVVIYILLVTSYVI